MQAGNQLELTVEKLVFGGDGLARADNNEVVFLPGAVPGEHVIAEIVKVKPHFSRGRILRREADSPDRVRPACPLAGRCPGCSLQHLDYAAENRAKDGMIRDLMRKVAAPDTVFEPFDGSSPEFGYRNKIKLQAHRVTGGLDVGFVGPDNTTVVDVPRCLLAEEAISRKLAELRADKGFYHSLHDGMEITFRNADRPGVCYFRNKAPRNLSWLRENLSIGEFSVPAGSFFQVNRAGCESLIASLTARCGAGRYARVLDLYCGAGLFGCAAARSGGVGEVVGVEIDPDAVEAARYNLARTPEVKSSFVAGDAAKNLPQILAGTGDETLAVLDPPRTGLDRGAVRAIGESSLRHLIYISCEPSTYARDAGNLAQYGFVIRSIKGINMFPRTGHFELFTELERR